MEEKISPDAELLLWAKARKGNLRPAKQKNGYAYLYRYRLGGKKQPAKNFPAGTDPDYIRAFISDIESKILKEKLGLEDFSNEAEPTPTPAKPQRLTVYELLEWYLREAIRESLADKEEARTYSLVTIEKNELQFKRFIGFLKSEDFPSDKVQIQHLHGYKSYLAEHGAVDRSAKQNIATIKAIFKRAFDHGLLPAYPFWGFKMRITSEARPRDLLTYEEMREVIRNIKNKSIRLICYFGMYGGFRLADVLRMKKENINHDKKIVTFWMAKRRKWIDMPIRDELARILVRFKGQSGPIIEVERKRGGRKSYAQYIPQTIRRAIKKVKGKSHHRSGPHTFRHSFSHILELNEVPWPAQQYLLGHKIRAMTGRYSHPEKMMNYFRKILAGVNFRIKTEDDDAGETMNKK